MPRQAHIQTVKHVSNRLYVEKIYFNIKIQINSNRYFTTNYQFAPNRNKKMAAIQNCPRNIFL